MKLFGFVPDSLPAYSSLIVTYPWLTLGFIVAYLQLTKGLLGYLEARMRLE